MPYVFGRVSFDVFNANLVKSESFFRAECTEAQGLQTKCVRKCVSPAQRIALSDMTQSEINELLGKLGFYKKAQPEDEVPEEFRFSPAQDSPFKDEVAHKPPPSLLATESTSSESNAEVEHTDL